MQKQIYIITNLQIQHHTGWKPWNASNIMKRSLIADLILNKDTQVDKTGKKASVVIWDGNIESSCRLEPT